MLTAVEETSLWTTAKIRAIGDLMDATVAYVSASSPKIYSRELVEVIFTQPYSRIGDWSRQSSAIRATASKYMKELVAKGVLQERQEGRENIYINVRFLELLTSEIQRLQEIRLVAALLLRLSPFLGRGSSVRQPALFQHAGDLRRAAAEGDVGLERIAHVAARVDVLLEPLGRSPRGTDRPPPRRPRRRRRPSPPTTDSCSSPPHSRRRCAGSAGMRWRMTISRGMPSRSSVARSKAATSRFSASSSACSSMSTSAEATYSTVEKPWLKLRAFLMRCSELLRHRLAGLVVEREALQHLRHHQPVLVELRGQLDEIARDAGARDRRIGDVGQEPVQAVPELVEQRARIVERQQRRRAFLASREVHHVDDDGPHLACDVRLRAQAAHPRARALRRPREVVAEEQPDVGAALVRHLPHAHVRVIAGDVGELLEAQPEQPLCRVECRRDHAVEREVGPRRRLVHVEARLALLLRVVAPVPRPRSRSCRPRRALAPAAPRAPRLRASRPPATPPAGGRARQPASSPWCRRGCSRRRSS